jgi:hypothetical protein
LRAEQRKYFLRANYSSQGGLRAGGVRTTPSKFTQ